MSRIDAKPSVNRIQWCKAVILGGSSGFLIAFGLLLLISWGISAGSVPPGREQAGVVTSALLAGLSGTLLAIRVSDLRGPLFGLAIGITVVLLQLSAGLFFKDSQIMSTHSLPTAISPIVGGLAGGLLLQGKKSKRKKHRTR